MGIPISGYWARTWYSRMKRASKQGAMLWASDMASMTESVVPAATAARYLGGV